MQDLKLESESLQHLLKGIRARAGDTLPVMNIIGEILLSSVEENFEREGRFSTPGEIMGGSSGWQRLAPSTVKQRKKKGKDGKILQVTGRLLASIHHEAHEDYVTVGTNAVYAAIHQFGGAIHRRGGRGIARLRLKRDGSLMKQEGYANLAVFANKKHKKVKKVEFTKKDFDIPIPARPFLVVQEEDIEEIREEVFRYLLQE